eukprot:2172622-Ditylum_brightwellii.AAC.1
MSFAIIAPVVVKFKCCDTMGVVDLAKILEGSRVDAFVDLRVGAMNSFFVKLEGMVVPEHSFQ